jgi:hypothetical protein
MTEAAAQWIVFYFLREMFTEINALLTGCFPNSTVAMPCPAVVMGRQIT